MRRGFVSLVCTERTVKRIPVGVQEPKQSHNNAHAENIINQFHLFLIRIIGACGRRCVGRYDAAASSRLVPLAQIDHSVLHSGEYTAPRVVTDASKFDSAGLQQRITDAKRGRQGARVPVRA